MQAYDDLMDQYQLKTEAPSEDGLTESFWRQCFRKMPQVIEQFLSEDGHRVCAKSIQSALVRSEVSERAQAELSQLCVDGFTALPDESFELELDMAEESLLPVTVGVLFSGGPAPGGHNVVWGLLEGVSRVEGSRLIGFVGGAQGLIEGVYKPIDNDAISSYRNEGGFDLLMSGRTKIKSAEQLQSALDTCMDLKLDVLVIIGGDDSNTNAAVLAQYFFDRGVKTRVLGVPKTIDADLRTPLVRMTFGHDSAAAAYSEQISAVHKDAKSSGKYTHFIRLMGRSASHITLECALRTQPTMVLLGEECRAKKQRLRDVVEEIAQTLAHRRKLRDERLGMPLAWGVVLIPEGIIEFIPEFAELVDEIGHIQTLGSIVSYEALESKLTPLSQALWRSLPKSFAQGLLADRDPHGNIQISLIESERLIAEMVAERMKELLPGEKYDYRTHFFGYEGRAVHPTPFDKVYSFILGATAALACFARDTSGDLLTGVMVAVDGLGREPTTWSPKLQSLRAMLRSESRQGKSFPVIDKALVSLSSRAYQAVQECRGAWARQEDPLIYSRVVIESVDRLHLPIALALES